MASSINLRRVAIGQTRPLDLPPYSTVYWHYKQWRSQGVLEELMRVLHSQVRLQVKKKQKWTTLMMLDSQAVKNTCNASIASLMLLFLQISKWY